MEETSRNKEELLNEIVKLRKQVAEMEKSEIILKQVEHALRESEKALCALMDATSDIMLLADTKGTLLAMNEAFIKRFGKTREELLGSDINYLFPPDVSKGRRARVNEVVSSRRSVCFEDERQGMLMENTFYPIFDVQGNIEKIAVHSREITKQKIIMDELQKSKEESDAKSKALEEFNITLKILLRQREEDIKSLEDRFASNVKNLVRPYLEEIKKAHMDDRCKSYIKIIEANLNEIVSPLSYTMRTLNLTPKEIQVASLIRDNRTTKEIAEILGVTTSAIDSHRINIRSKLGVSKRHINLQSYLQSLT